MSELMTVDEVAELFGVSRQCLWAWNKKRFGPLPIKLGPKCVRYSKVKVEQFIRCRETGEPFERRQGYPSIASRKPGNF